MVSTTMVSNNAIRVTQTLQNMASKLSSSAAPCVICYRHQAWDFDVATNATPEQVKRLFRRAFIIGRRFQIVHVMFRARLD